MANNRCGILQEKDKRKQEENIQIYRILLEHTSPTGSACAPFKTMQPWPTCHLQST